MTLPLYLTTEAGDRLLTEGSDYLVGERSYAPYEGYNIFDLQVNWADNPTERLARNMTVLENVTGRPLVRSHTAGPIGALDVLFTLEGRDQIKEFRSWLKSFRGRQVPVWLPTWQRDLEATQDLTGSSITVESVGYAGWLYPHAARKHLAIIDYTRTIYPVGVTSASDNGTTETLGISPALASTLTAEHTMISFLVLARLAQDEVTMDYHGHSLVDVAMRFIEVPREVPTP